MNSENKRCQCICHCIIDSLCVLLFLIVVPWVIHCGLDFCKEMHLWECFLLCFGYLGFVFAQKAITGCLVSCRACSSEKSGGLSPSKKAIVKSETREVDFLFFKYRRECTSTEWLAAEDTKKKENQSHPYPLFSFLVFLLQIFSIDYTSCNLIKQSITHKSAKARFILWQNGLNLIFTFILCAFCIFCDCDFLHFLLIVRTLSRTMEISLAFVGDVISSRQKSSSLTAAQRIPLAIISLVEEILLFTVIYCCVFESDAASSLLYGLHSLILSEPTFKCGEKAAILPFVGLYQAVSAFVLVSLALVSYISDKQNS